MVKQNKVYIRMRDGNTTFDNVRAVRGGLNLNWALINPVFSFEILVPMEMANYYGIRLIIEYAVDLEKPEWTVYDVWLTDDADLVREYQYSDYIQCPIETEEIQMKILEHANRWQCLFEAVGEFAAKLRRKKATPPKVIPASAGNTSQEERPKHKMSIIAPGERTESATREFGSTD